MASHPHVQDMGKVPGHLFESFRAKSLPRVRADLAAGDYVGWLIPHPENEQTIIAGAGVLLRQIPPFPLRHLSGETTVAEGRQALIVNVFTEPEWRRRSLARMLMEQIITWSCERRIESLVLHASEHGRALYEQLGFIQTNEMRLGG